MHFEPGEKQPSRRQALGLVGLQVPELGGLSLQDPQLLPGRHQDRGGAHRQTGDHEEPSRVGPEHGREREVEAGTTHHGRLSAIVPSVFE